MRPSDSPRAVETSSPGGTETSSPRGPVTTRGALVVSVLLATLLLVGWILYWLIASQRG